MGPFFQSPGLVASIKSNRATAVPLTHHIDLQEIISWIVLRSGMDMAESHVVSALANKRAEIAGMIARAQQQLCQFRAELVHLRFSALRSRLGPMRLGDWLKNVPRHA
jgi:hypothetical protein